jgi:hypothetical protein
LQTPSGNRVNSSSYQDGQFHLLLPNPLEGGSYTCTLPLTALDVTCSSGNSSAQAHASVAVDTTAGRLSIVEAQQTDLIAENGELKQQLSQVSSTFHYYFSLYLFKNKKKTPL